jgi:hypothetical protein
VTGRTGSDEPATESGIDLSAGDADAVTDGGPELPDDAGRPQGRSGRAAQADIESAARKSHQSSLMYCPRRDRRDGTPTARRRRFSDWRGIRCGGGC